MAKRGKAVGQTQKDFAETVAETLLEQLKQGTAPWQKPWVGGDERRMPYNPSSGKDYRGGNAMYLWAVGMMEGYTDARWMTYRQAAGEGAQVKKGEHGTRIQYVMFGGEQPATDDNGKPVIGADGKQKKQWVDYERPRIMHYTVFNASQIDGLAPVVPRPTMPEWQRHEVAEAILTASGAAIEHQEGNRAFYSPKQDSITLPMREQFPTADGYYATALHELGHWTGHETRLDRDLSHPFGSEGYAKEELRAEIASLMLGDRLGIGHDPTQHAAYVGSWIKALEEDPREIFRAAADSEKITSYVLGLQQTQQQNQEQTNAVAPPVADAALMAELRELHADANEGYSPLTSWENLSQTAQQRGLVASIARTPGGADDTPPFLVTYAAQDGTPTAITTGLFADGKALTSVDGQRIEGTGYTADDEWQRDALTKASILEKNRSQPQTATTATRFEKLAGDFNDRYEALDRPNGIERAYLVPTPGAEGEFWRHEDLTEAIERANDNGLAQFYSVNSADDKLVDYAKRDGDWYRERPVVPQLPAEQIEANTPALAAAIQGQGEPLAVLAEYTAIRQGIHPSVAPGADGVEAADAYAERFAAQAPATAVRFAREWKADAGRFAEEAATTPERVNRFANDIGQRGVEARTPGSEALQRAPAVGDYVRFTPNGKDFAARPTVAGPVQGVLVHHSQAAGIGDRWKIAENPRDLSTVVTVYQDQGDLRPADMREQTPLQQAAVYRPQEPAMSNERKYLAVPYKEKDQAKAAGAKWDKVAKSWYAPEGADAAKLAPWLPENRPSAQAIVDDVKQQFADALKAEKFQLDGEPIMDGNLQRVKVEGDKGEETSGAYVGHLDGILPAGYIQNFKTGVKTNWKADQAVPQIGEQDRARLETEAAEKRAARDQERDAAYRETAGRVTAELTAAEFAPDDHPYLVSKGLSGPSGLRVDDKGNLLVPVHGNDFNGEFSSLQRIGPDGRKGFEKDGKVAGGYFMTVRPTGELSINNPKAPIIIAEGWATAETIGRAIGATTVTAFTSGNLEAVAKAIREKYPDRPIIIAGDNDVKREREGKPNVGKAAAMVAAEAVGGHAAIPQFKRDQQGSDWNDIAHSQGNEVVKQAMLESLAIADRRMIADARYTGHDGTRAAEVATLHQSEVNQQTVGDSNEQAVAIKSTFTRNRDTAEAVEEKQEREPQKHTSGRGRSR